MRILAGKHKNKSIFVPKNIRPTTSMVREAVFNILIHSFDGVINKTVIDICCGSGAFGFEALSRGAKHSVFLDKNGLNLKTAKQNAEKLAELGNCQFINCDAKNLSRVRTLTSFDIIFIDPPYREDISHILEDVSNILAQDGVIIFEMHLKMDIKIPAPLKLDKEKRYGNTKLLFLSHNDSNE